MRETVGETRGEWSQRGTHEYREGGEERKMERNERRAERKSIKERW